jgi:hypothetical protein
MLIIDYALVLAGAVIWELWKSEKDTREIQGERTDKRLSAIITELDTLTAEKREMSHQISQLRENFSEFQRSGAAIPAKNTYVHPPVSYEKISRPSSNSSKWEMLKQILDDNIKLRTKPEN